MTEIGEAAVITGSFTLAGVVITLIVTLWFENKRRTLEHKRWYVDYFIGDKIKSFRKLHVTLVDCHFTMNSYGNAPPQTQAEFDGGVLPKQATYLDAMVMASIYLNEDENKVLSEALGGFRQASRAIWSTIPTSQGSVQPMNQPINLNWTLFTNTYEKAEKLLKEKLNPELLKEIERAK